MSVKLYRVISSLVSDLSLWNLASYLILRPSFPQRQWIFVYSISLRWNVAKNLWKGERYLPNKTKLKVVLSHFTILYRCVQTKCLQIYCQAWLWNYNSAEGCSFTFYNILQVYSLQVSANLLPSEIMKITTQEFLPGWHHLLGKTL